MAATPYKPVSWNGEPITLLKLNQMASNDQFLFENTPRVRYFAGGITKDTGTKVLAGKTPFSANAAKAINVNVYFGSFFSSGCHPVVTATIQTGGPWWSKYVSIHGLTKGDIDRVGFVAHVKSHEEFKDKIEAGGWIHWTAVGY